MGIVFLFRVICDFVFRIWFGGGNYFGDGGDVGGVGDDGCGCVYESMDGLESNGSTVWVSERRI